MFFRLIIALCICTNIVAQSDSAVLSMLRHPITKNATITRGRKAIYNKFIMHDKTGANAIINYLTTKIEDSTRLALYPEEKWALNYWLNQHNAIIKSVVDYDSSFLKIINKKQKPRRDDLQENLIEKLAAQRTFIYNQIITDEQISDTDKVFLKLNFDYLLSWGESKDVLEDSINSIVSRFNKLYPNSKYNNYLNKYIGVEYKNSNWSFASEFFSGFGIMTNDLRKTFSNTIPLGFSFDISYKRCFLNLRDYVGFGQTKDNIKFFEGTWNKHENMRVFIPQIAIGISVLNTEKLKIAPFIGATATIISTPIYYSNTDLGLGPTATSVFGIRTDVFLKRPKKEIDNWSGTEFRYLRFMYSFVSPHFERKYTGFKGYMHNITIGLVLLNKPRWRVK